MEEKKDWSGSEETEKGGWSQLGVRLAKLLDVKSIVTFALIGTLCILALRQNVAVPPEALVAVVTAVITYFFTRSNHNANDRKGE